MKKQPFTYKEKAVYLVHPDFNHEPIRVEGYWNINRIFHSHTLKLGELILNEHYNIFSTFEEAKQVALEIVDQNIQGAQERVKALQEEKRKLEQMSKFSYQETQFYVISEEAEMFPYIDKIELVEGYWGTVDNSKTSQQVYDFEGDSLKLKNIKIDNELLVFHRNKPIKGVVSGSIVPDTHLFHSYEEALVQANKWIEERKAVIKEKVKDKVRELDNLRNLGENCTNIKLKIEGYL